MKVLTLTEPWASLIMCGAKHYETRGWQTSYRGPLLIHAAKGMPKGPDYLLSLPFAGGVLAANLCPGRCITLSEIMVLLNQRRGKILGSVFLDRIKPVESVRDTLSVQERAFGDYSDDRYAWHIASRELFKDFIPARGMLGLWEFDHPTFDNNET